MTPVRLFVCLFVRSFVRCETLLAGRRPVNPPTKRRRRKKQLGSDDKVSIRHPLCHNTASLLLMTESTKHKRLSAPLFLTEEGAFKRQHKLQTLCCTLLMLDSRLSIILLPGCMVSSPFCPCSTSDCTFLQKVKSGGRGMGGIG